MFVILSGVSTFIWTFCNRRSRRTRSKARDSVEKNRTSVSSFSKPFYDVWLKCRFDWNNYVLL